MTGAAVAGDIISNTVTGVTGLLELLTIFPTFPEVNIFFSVITSAALVISAVAEEDPTIEELGDPSVAELDIGAELTVDAITMFLFGIGAVVVSSSFVTTTDDDC